MANGLIGLYAGDTGRVPLDLVQKKRADLLNIPAFQSANFLALGFPAGLIQKLKTLNEYGASNDDIYLQIKATLDELQLSSSNPPGELLLSILASAYQNELLTSPNFIEVTTRLINSFMNNLTVAGIISQRVLHPLEEGKKLKDLAAFIRHTYPYLPKNALPLSRAVGAISAELLMAKQWNLLGPNGFPLTTFATPITTQDNASESLYLLEAPDAFYVDEEGEPHPLPLAATSEDFLKFLKILGVCAPETTLKDERFQEYFIQDASVTPVDMDGRPTLIHTGRYEKIEVLDENAVGRATKVVEQEITYPILGKAINYKKLIPDLLKAVIFYKLPLQIIEDTLHLNVLKRRQATDVYFDIYTAKFRPSAHGYSGALSLLTCAALKLNECSPDNDAVFASICRLFATLDFKEFQNTVAVSIREITRVSPLSIEGLLPTNSALEFFIKGKYAPLGQSELEQDAAVEYLSRNTEYVPAGISAETKQLALAYLAKDKDNPEAITRTERIVGIIACQQTFQAYFLEQEQALAKTVLDTIIEVIRNEILTKNHSDLLEYLVSTAPNYLSTDVISSFVKMLSAEASTNSAASSPVTRTSAIPVAPVKTHQKPSAGASMDDESEEITPTRLPSYPTNEEIELKNFRDPIGPQVTDRSFVSGDPVQTAILHSSLIDDPIRIATLRKQLIIGVSGLTVTADGSTSSSVINTLLQAVNDDNKTKKVANGQLWLPFGLGLKITDKVLFRILANDHQHDLLNTPGFMDWIILLRKELESTDPKVKEIAENKLIRLNDFLYTEKYVGGNFAAALLRHGYHDLLKHSADDNGLMLTTFKYQAPGDKDSDVRTVNYLEELSNISLMVAFPPPHDGINDDLGASDMITPICIEHAPLQKKTLEHLKDFLGHFGLRLNKNIFSDIVQDYPNITTRPFGGDLTLTHHCFIQTLAKSAFLQHIIRVLFDDLISHGDAQFSATLLTEALELLNQVPEQNFSKVALSAFGIPQFRCSILGYAALRLQQNDYSKNYLNMICQGLEKHPCFPELVQFAFIDAATHGNLLALKYFAESKTCRKYLISEVISMAERRCIASGYISCVRKDSVFEYLDSLARSATAAPQLPFAQATLAGNGAAGAGAGHGDALQQAR